jgi:hypothetical protein
VKAVWLILSVSFPLLFSSCDSEDTSSHKSDGLIPLEVGGIWSYQAQQPFGIASDTVSAVTKIGGVFYYQVKGDLLGRMTGEGEWLRNSGDNVLVFDVALGEEDTLFAQGVAVGETWSTFTKRCVYRCDNDSVIATPAGEFQDVPCFEWPCVPIPDNGTICSVASHVGIARLTRGSIAGAITYELTNYSAPNRSFNSLLRPASHGGWE